MSEGKNTDREIWRKVEGDFYSPSIHVTENGDIGIGVGGHVLVAPVERWHEAGNKVLAVDPDLKPMTLREEEWEVKRVIGERSIAFGSLLTKVLLVVCLALFVGSLFGIRLVAGYFLFYLVLVSGMFQLMARIRYRGRRGGKR